MHRASKCTEPRSSFAFVVLLGIFWVLTSEAQPVAIGADSSNFPLREELRFLSPYPFTKDELMAKLLEVTAMPEGRVTKKQIESIFLMKFPVWTSSPRGSGGQKDEASVEDIVSYSAHSGIDWYFDMGVKNGPGSDSEFAFIVSQPSRRVPDDFSRKLPDNMCIKESVFDDFLKAQGWERVSRELENNHFWIGISTYIKDKRALMNFGLSPVGGVWPAKWFCIDSIGVFSNEAMRARWLR